MKSHSNPAIYVYKQRFVFVFDRKAATSTVTFPARALCPLCKVWFDFGEIIWLMVVTERVVQVTELVFEERGPAGVQAGVVLGRGGRGGGGRGGGRPGLLHDGGVVVQCLGVAVAVRLALSGEHARLERPLVDREARAGGVGWRLEHVGHAEVHGEVKCVGKNPQKNGRKKTLLRCLVLAKMSK